MNNTNTRNLPVDTPDVISMDDPTFWNIVDGEPDPDDGVDGKHDPYDSNYDENHPWFQITRYQIYSRLRHEKR
jgi:hypothetical protein